MHRVPTRSSIREPPATRRSSSSPAPDAGRGRGGSGGFSHTRTDEEVTPMATEVDPELAGLSKQNGASIGRLLATGKIGYAEEGPDGRMSARIRIPPDELSWEPAVLVLPHGGDLDLELTNDDLNTHCALLPSNGDFKFLWLVNQSRGTASIQ